jgi:hypothetical protein
LTLVRFGKKGAEKPGVIDPSGDIRDLSNYIEDWSYKTLNHKTLNDLKSSDLTEFPAVSSEARPDTPIDQVGKIVAYTQKTPH